MPQYNIDTLSFLISSFRDIIQSFGQNSKSVAFYKRQVNQLINIGQVSIEDAELVEEVIGMKNTDSVKWDSAEKKLSQFINAISCTCSIDDETNKIIVIEQLSANDEISQSVKDLVYRVYGIQCKPTDVQKQLNRIRFGEIPTDKPLGCADNTYSGKQYKSTSMTSLNRLMKLDMTLKVKNSEAVCSGDPSYYSCNMSNIMKCGYVLRELAKGSTYVIGKPELSDPCCRSTHVVTDNNAMALAGKIDWEEVLRYYKKNKENEQ